MSGRELTDEEKLKFRKEEKEVQASSQLFLLDLFNILSCPDQSANQKRTEGTEGSCETIP